MANVINLNDHLKDKYDEQLITKIKLCRIRDEIDGDAKILVGTTLDPTIEGLIRVSVVATGIDSLSAFSQEAFLCDSSIESHVLAFQSVLAGQIPPLENRLRLAKNHTYELRTLRMINEISKMN